MRARRTAQIIRKSLGLAAVGLGGCVSSFGSPARDAARPAAEAALANAPDLLPKLPVASTTATRGQRPEVTPAGGNSAAAAPQVAAKIRASVNGIPILDEELREAMTPYLGELMRVPEDQREAAVNSLAQRELDRLIERELVLEQAYAVLKAQNNTQAILKLNASATEEADKRIRDIRKQLKLSTDDDLKAAMQAQGLTVAGMRRQIERNFVMMEYMRNLIYPYIQGINLAKIRDYYESHPEEFQSEDKLRWQDIFVDAGKFASPAEARAFAEKLRARAAAGEDFAALAKQYDDGDSKLRGGDGLGTKRGEVTPPQVDAMIWSLKAGQVGPLVDMGFGFHVVRVASRDYAGRKPFDIPTQDAIRKKLTNIIADREYKNVVDEMRKKATVTVYQ
jgi:peptidyl-prolyl cis-trans isomerase SurA